MPTISFLNFQYNLSKRRPMKRRPSKPARCGSCKDTHFSGLLQTFQPNEAELKQVFDKFDADKDKKISRDDYKLILRALRKENIEDEVQKVFEVAASNGHKFIDFEEFKDVHKGGIKAMDIQSAFWVFDLNSDGKISAEDVFEVLSMLKEICSLDDCRRMVRAVDTNGDGFVDMDEFMHMMTRTMKQI